MSTDFGKRVVQARKHARLTQVQLAQAVGVAQSTIGEAEKKGFGSSYTPQIAAACGVSPHWLATGDGPMVLEPGQAAPAGPKRSAHAMLLAECFDMLTDPTARHLAYNAATAAILQFLPERETPPTAGRKAAARAKKQPA